MFLNYGMSCLKSHSNIVVQSFCRNLTSRCIRNFLSLDFCNFWNFDTFPIWYTQRFIDFLGFISILFFKFSIKSEIILVQKWNICPRNVRHMSASCPRDVLGVSKSANIWWQVRTGADDSGCWMSVYVGGHMADTWLTAGHLADTWITFGPNP